MNRKAKSPSRTQAGGLDLASLFGAAAQALSANQSALNQADTFNQNHGDNMVQAFNMITQVLAQQQKAPPARQLNQASRYLSQHGTSGSAQAYSQGLAQAARQFKGQKAVTPENAALLIQSLLGGGQTAQPGGADMLGSQLGGQQAGTATGGQPGGVDLAALLNAGMAFMDAKNQGQDNLQAALTALISAGPLGPSAHRQQSGQVVANALLQAVSALARK